jgi:outer membrane receptor protein involved in Fe transport
MANTILNAGFLQLDNQFSNALRIVWGARVEHYDQLVGSVKTSDSRHSYTKVFDVLPGVNATYKLSNKTNLRLSGSQTVVRPELRELSFLNIYDFDLNASVQGSPTLKRTKVTNLDLRYEVYPQAGEVFTVGAFYKRFKDPIEQLYERGAGGSSTFFFRNPDKATAYGIELETRKSLAFAGLRNFTFQANTSFIYSRVKDSTFEVDRPLQGQSPYVLNFGLLYDLPGADFNATLLYNQIGKRIYVVGNNNLASAGAPDVYEAYRPLLDLQLTKKILKTKGEIKINISDILNQTQYFYQNTTNDRSLEKDKDPYRFTRKFGTTFGFTFGYTL